MRTEVNKYMENTDLRIEISREVMDTKQPHKIKRYDLVLKKDNEKKVEKEQPFSWYSPGIGSFLAKNPVNYEDFTPRGGSDV